VDDLKERRGYSHLKEEALDRTMWTARFGRGFGPVVRQTTKWMSHSTPIRLWRLNRQCVPKRQKKNSDAGELPRRKHTTYRTRRKFEINNFPFICQPDRQQYQTGRKLWRCCNPREEFVRRSVCLHNRRDRSRNSLVGWGGEGGRGSW